MQARTLASSCFPGSLCLVVDIRVQENLAVTSAWGGFANPSFLSFVSLLQKQMTWGNTEGEEIAWMLMVVLSFN